MSFIAWALSFFIGNPMGRLIGGIALTLIGTGVLLFAAYRKGVNAERMKQTARKLENAKARMKIDDDTTRMSRAERQKALEGWFTD